MLYYSSQFCNELFLKNDIEVKVAIASYYSWVLYNQEIKLIKIRSNPNMISFMLDSLNIFYHFCFLLKIIYFKPDIVHFIDNHPWYSIYVRIFKGLGMQIDVTQHDPFPHSGETYSILDRVAIYTNKVLRAKSDRLIVLWEKLKKDVINKYLINEKKVIAIPHWAYTFFNQFSQNLKVKKNTFLFFGRIVDYKWLDALLASLEKVKKEIPDFHLIIAGPGDISQYQATLNKYKKNISLYNFEIAAEDAYKYFEVSEFIVLPYHDATGSGVIPVAYCFKKAVITTDVWELSSVVVRWITWDVISFNDPVSLSNAIVHMLQYKDDTKKMWEAWYQYSIDKLSWKPIIKKIYN
jgi:starch synthase